MNKVTITSSLIKSILAILLLSSIIIGYLVFNFAKQRYEEVVINDMKSIVFHTNNHFLTNIKYLTQELNNIANSRPITEYMTNPEPKIIKESFSIHGSDFSILGFVNNKNEIIARFNPFSIPISKDMDILKLKKELLKKAKNKPNKVIYSDIKYFENIKKQCILFAIYKTNFFDEDIGVILGLVPIDEILESNIPTINENYKYRILSKNNDIIFSSIKDDTLSKFTINIKQNTLKKYILQKKEEYIYYSKYDYGNIVVTLPYSYYTNMIYHNIKGNIVIFIAILLLSIFFIYYIAYKITKPLLFLVDQINNNNNNNIVNIGTDTEYQEIIILTNTFNSLALALYKEKQSLLDLNKNLELTVQNEVDKNIQKELQLFEQSKMANMGTMIGNIAHQWRQPLSVISSIASGVKFKQEFGILTKEETDRYMDNIVERTLYLSDTITTFRNFLKEKKELMEVVLQDRIDTALNIVKFALDDNAIKLQTNIDYINPIKVTIVLGELSEVIINIINNAKDILIEKQINDAWVHLVLITENNTAIITIEDNGGGIPEDILPNIFDEYFTTKDEDIGTGLGLYMSYEIITKSLNGKLYAKNTPNGAKFFIEIPCEII